MGNKYKLEIELLIEIKLWLLLKFVYTTCLYVEYEFKHLGNWFIIVYTVDTNLFLKGVTYTFNVV